MNFIINVTEPFHKYIHLLKDFKDNIDKWRDLALY